MSFVVGITVGSLFFVAVSGLLYVTPLFLQQGERLSSFATASTMALLSVGIIVTAFAFRSRLERRGRRLVAAGVSVTLLGVSVYLAMTKSGAARPALLTVPLLCIGLGSGVGSTALGDVEGEQGGSASGTLNALQQVATAVDAALVSTVFLPGVKDRGVAGAATTSLTAVLVVLMLCGTPSHATAPEGNSRSPLRYTRICRPDLGTGTPRPAQVSLRRAPQQHNILSLDPPMIWKA